jgi:hypothetical protein
VEVTYEDGRKALAWTGVQLDDYDFISPFTGTRCVGRAGEPWSSRNPIFEGQA